MLLGWLVVHISKVEQCLLIGGECRPSTSGSSDRDCDSTISCSPSSTNEEGVGSREPALQSPTGRALSKVICLDSSGEIPASLPERCEK